MIRKIRPCKYKLIVGRYLVKSHKHRLYLRREHVYSPDLQHIVRAPSGLCHSCKGSSALARLIIYLRDVLCPVTKDRYALLGKGRYNKLSLAALVKHIACLWVDYLRKEVILVNVHSAALFALARNARSHKLTHAVVVRNEHTKCLLYLISHLNCAALRAKQSQFEIDLVKHALLLCKLAYVLSIRRSGNQRVCAEILHQHYLLFGISA